MPFPKLTQPEKDFILSYAKTHPDASIQEITDHTNKSTTCVWNLLRKNNHKRTFVYGQKKYHSFDNWLPWLCNELWKEDEVKVPSTIETLSEPANNLIVDKQLSSSYSVPHNWKRPKHTCSIMPRRVIDDDDSCRSDKYQYMIYEKLMSDNYWTVWSESINRNENVIIENKIIELREDLFERVMEIAFEILLPEEMTILSSLLSGGTQVEIQNNLSYANQSEISRRCKCIQKTLQYHCFLDEECQLILKDIADYMNS